MANQIRIKRRAAGGGAGAPSSLMNAELAFNEDDSKLYIGIGDNGAGIATSILTLGGPGAHVTLNTNQDVSGDKTFSGTLNVTGTLQIGGVAVTATAAEINHLSGVTSGVQSQINTITTDISQTQTAIGITQGDTDLGTFGGSGSTLTDGITVKAALEELEAAVEAGNSSLAGDSGTASGSSITIAGGTGLTTTGDNSSTITVDLDDTTVTAASYGAAGSVGTFTVDGQGRLTAAADVSISITHDQVSDFDTGVQSNRLDQMAAPTADVSLNGQKITGLADPVNAQDAVTKSYADALVTGLDVKDSVRVATTANITLSGTQTVDGVSLLAGDRVLVKNQSTASQNGIYDVVNGGAWTRSSDADENAEVTSGLFAFVEEGTTNNNTGWVLATENPITVGTTALAFTQFSGTGETVAGAGLTKTGSTIDVETADSGRIVVNANDIDLAFHGTAGTYNGLTVDAYGRVSSFSQPTTLAGYGITDAQPLDATLTALAGVATSADQLIYTTGSDAFAVTSLSTFARSILDDADAGATRTTLGLGTMAIQDANNVDIDGGTIDGITIDGGTF